MDDDRGPFDPSAGLASFSRRALAALGREYMLFGHLLNRAGLPWVHAKIGPQAREAIAIEEWMGASPIYTRRMQQSSIRQPRQRPSCPRSASCNSGRARFAFRVRPVAG